MRWDLQLSSGDKTALKTGLQSCASELAAAPSDFVQSALKAAFINPCEGVTQLANHLEGKADVAVAPDSNDVAFGSLRWHVRQFGGAIGTMLPYYLSSKLTSGLGHASSSLLKFATKGSEFEQGAVKFAAIAGKYNILHSAATGVLMEGACRPVYAGEGDFNEVRAINAGVGAVTFTTLGVLPGALKTYDQKRFSIDQPWLVNSVVNDIRTHVASGAIAGALDAETRSILTKHDIADPLTLIQSAYGYGILGGAMRSATEVVPLATKGASINDIIELTPKFRSRANLDPVVKELLADYGTYRLKNAEIKSSKDNYDLFAHAQVPEAQEFKLQLAKHEQANAGTKGKSEDQEINVDRLFDSYTPSRMAMSVSELLRSKDLAKDQECYCYHPIEFYATALKHFSPKVNGYYGIGKDSVALELENGDALKIHTQALSNGEGERFFDIPSANKNAIDLLAMVKSVQYDYNSGNDLWFQSMQFKNIHGQVYHLTQPAVPVCVPKVLARRFADHMPKIDYAFYDFLPEQLGFYDGRIVLIDYFSVIPKDSAKINEIEDSRPLLDRLIEAAERAPEKVTLKH